MILKFYKNLSAGRKQVNHGDEVIEFLWVSSCQNSLSGTQNKSAKFIRPYLFLIYNRCISLAIPNTRTQKL